MNNPQFQNETRTIGSDQLRKAIERNRAKVLKQSDDSFNTIKVDKKEAHQATRQQFKKIEDIPIFDHRIRSVNKPSASKIKKFKFLQFLAKKKFLVILGWMFNLFLLTRLFFSDNGVIDYYQMAKILNDQQNDILKLEVENLAINKEISTIKTDRSYQKKLVRDHLGFIEQDEYLVIFAKETSN